MKHTDTRDGPNSSPEARADFDRHDTPMSALLGAHDWSGSTLGPPHSWPPALRAAASLVLDSPMPVWLAWGPDLAMLYNGHYAGILGDKHPAALGAPLQSVWAEVWPDVGSLVAQALAGQSVYQEDLPLVVRRHGSDEATWFTFSYAPLRDDDGTPRGLICNVWETTAKVLAQRSLVESESRMRALTQASTNVVYRMNADWSHVLELNGQGFVADVAQPDANWMQSYIPPADRAEVSAAVVQAVRHRRPFELEHRVLRVDGTPGWMLSRAIPVLDDQGRVVEWFGTATDVTVSRESRRALERQNLDLERRVEDSQAQRQLLAAIVESTHAIVHAVDLQGRWMALNGAARTAWAAMCGTQPRLGEPLLDALGPLQGSAWENAWRAALAGKEHTVLLDWRDPERGLRTHELSFNLLRHATGQVYGVYQVGVDITERLDEQRRLKEARAALAQAHKRETEERHRLAVLATNDAVWDWRIADGQVVWNRALATLFGHELEASDAHWWLSHIHPDDRGRIDAGIHAVIEGAASSWSDEYRFQRADGSYASVLDRGTV
ncbi:MAG: PAS domain S-box protein, partial [Comamonadaceae bacterium]